VQDITNETAICHEDVAYILDRFGLIKKQNEIICDEAVLNEIIE
jgi:hypothetical protein